MARVTKITCDRCDNKLEIGDVVYVRLSMSSPPCGGEVDLCDLCLAHMTMTLDTQYGFDLSGKNIGINERISD